LRRAEKGISQIALAKHLDISSHQVQKYEKGVNRVGASRLQQIAEMLGVDMPFFYDGTASTACHFGRDDCGFSALIFVAGSSAQRRNASTP
jgi:transcriptional regulator with XRE-family HTH domain